MTPLSAAEAEIVAGLDPVLRPVALRHRDAALRAGHPFVFISGLRSRSQQAGLATDPNRATPAAPAGMSKHEVGGAYDLKRQTPAVEAAVGVLGEQVGLRWGGRFKPTPDPNHFEAPFARAELAAYRRVQLIGAVLAVGLVISIASDG